MYALAPKSISLLLLGALFLYLVITFRKQIPSSAIEVVRRGPSVRTFMSADNVPSAFFCCMGSLYAFGPPKIEYLNHSNIVEYFSIISDYHENITVYEHYPHRHLKKPFNILRTLRTSNFFSASNKKAFFIRYRG